MWYCSWYQLSPELEPASDTSFFQDFSLKLQSVEILDGSACLTVSSSLGASLFFPAPMFQLWPPTQSPNLRVSFETSFPEVPLNPKINYLYLPRAMHTEDSEESQHWLSYRKFLWGQRTVSRFALIKKDHSGGLESKNVLHTDDLLSVMLSRDALVGFWNITLPGDLFYWPSKVFASLFYFTVEPKYMIQTDVPLLTESNFINLKRKSMHKIRYTTTNTVWAKYKSK